MEHRVHCFDDRRGRHILKIIGWVILGLIGVTVFAFLFGYFVMLLWNWLMPAIFGLGLITFWQAVAIIVLARLIFGGFKHKHDRNGSHPFKRNWNRKKKNDFKENWYKWKYYDDFWKEEGEKSFDDYVERKSED